MRSLQTTLLLTVLGTSSPLLAQCDLEGSLTAPESGAVRFGAATALHGDLLLVGGTGAKAAYLHQRQAADWTFVAKLEDGQPSGITPSWAGFDVDFAGPTRAFVGAHGESSPNVDRHGAVLVFEDGGSGWTQTAKLVPSDLPEYADFGLSLDGDGDWLVVGAQGRNSIEGAAYFFEHVGGQWVERQMVVPKPGGPYQNGIEVALEDELAVVTVLRESENYGWGMLHVYELAGGVWTHLQALEAPIVRGSDWIQGQSVVIADGRILAGTAAGYGQSGDLALVWERGANGFEVAAYLTPPPDAPAPHFGILVGAVGPCFAVASADRLHLFEESEGTWLRAADIDLGLGIDELQGWYMHALSVGEDVIAVGQPDHSPQNAGRVLVVSPAPEVSTFCAGTVCPCGNTYPHAGCATSTGAGAWIEACGSTGVAADDLTLRVAGLPLNQFCIVFMGPGEQSSTLGDGRLCIAPGGAGLFRYLPPQHSGSAGSITLGPGIVTLSQSFSSAGQITAGQTWGFQGWFRDPNGPCGTTFGVSSAVRVTFLP